MLAPGIDGEIGAIGIIMLAVALQAVHAKEFARNGIQGNKDSSPLNLFQELLKGRVDERSVDALICPLLERLSEQRVKSLWLHTAVFHSFHNNLPHSEKHIERGRNMNDAPPLSLFEHFKNVLITRRGLHDRHHLACCLIPTASWCTSSR